MDHHKYVSYSILIHIVSIIFIVPFAVSAEYPENLVIQNETIADGEYLRFIATLTMTAGPAVEIENGARVILGAGNRITLLPGFRVVNGSVSLFINKDTDADGLFDWWETAFFNDLSQGSGEDFDGDLITNANEFHEDLNPASYDTDNDQDGIADWWELSNFGSLEQGPDGDYDNDNNANLLEHLAGTNPRSASDTPGDGTYYGYDESGRLYSVFELSNGNVQLKMDFDYDDVGNITRKAIGDGTPVQN